MRPQHRQVRVAYAFEAEAEGELTVGVGDVVKVLLEMDGWYSVVREADGAAGLIPMSYVDPEPLA